MRGIDFADFRDAFLIVVILSRIKCRRTKCTAGRHG